ncbi:hypothetical protein, partial [Staphylococcus aureus]
TDLEGNLFRPIIEQLFAHRVHWLTCIGNACLVAGVFFAIKNYVWQQPIDRDEGGIEAFLARLLGRSMG